MSVMIISWARRKLSVAVGTENGKGVEEMMSMVWSTRCASRLPASTSSSSRRDSDFRLDCRVFVINARISLMIHLLLEGFLIINLCCGLKPLNF